MKRKGRRKHILWPISPFNRFRKGLLYKVREDGHVWYAVHVGINHRRNEVIVEEIK